MCLKLRFFDGFVDDDDYSRPPPRIQLIKEEVSKGISVLQEAPDEGVSDDRVRHCLAFTRMELISMMELLESSAAPDEECPWWWLRELQDASLWVSTSVHHVDGPLPTTLLLLGRAARRCTRRRSYDDHSAAAITDGAARCCKLLQNSYCKLRFLRRPSSGDDDPPAGPAPDATVVGVDGPAMKLLGWATAADDQILPGPRVISIVGPAGIGKTTLAMEFINRTLHGSCSFQCCAMATAGRAPDVKKLLQHILSQVNGSAAPALVSFEGTTDKAKNVRSTTASYENERELLRQQIRDHLQHKRYFILIDDIWDIRDWHRIKDFFPNNEHNSLILVTTCFTSISRSCCSDYKELVHEMEPLSKSDSERLLFTRAFGKDDHLPTSSVKLICDEILKRCEGIPLFITGMADWLKREWQQQEAKMKSFTLYRVEEQVPMSLKQFEQALLPTYNDLPDVLKLLLLYMTSIFPQGYQFKKERLIVKWLSQEGLTHRLDIKDQDEEKAEEYFSELVNRNIITPAAANRRHNNPDEAEACEWKISHFMWQVLAAISAERGFALTSDTLISTTALEAAGGGDKTETPLRRLALHHPNPNLSALFETMDLSRTRWLVMSGTVDRIPLDKFLYLVVLDLEGWENLKDEDMVQICSKMYLLLHLSIRNTRVSKLPIHIKELCSLRTLDVSHTLINELPTEIRGLCNLETLDMSHTEISELPTQIMKELYGLRTLDASHTKISALPSEVYMLKNLWRLDVRSTQIRQLPQHKHKPRSLGHILVGGEVAAKIPKRIQLPDSLRTLATIDLSKHPASLVRSLGDLIHLRVLAITWSFHQCTDKDHREALLSSITKWKELESLTIHCGFSCCMDFLESLSDDPPHRSLAGLLRRLEKFKVTAGTFTSVPSWIGILNSLSFVQITVCSLGANDVKKLGGLPRLHYLVLGLEFIPREEIAIESEGFSWLFTFSVNCPMPWLTFKEGAMRRLECLKLEVCSGPANRECAVPSGIINLGSLTEVVLHYNQDWCASSSSVKNTVEAVKDEVTKHCNSINLFINGSIHN